MFREQRNIDYSEIYQPNNRLIERVSEGEIQIYTPCNASFLVSIGTKKRMARK